ncbi:MAG: methyltransferase domain-containing protein [bacterium]
MEKKEIIDIGGGLRIDKKKNNRYDKSREWIIPLLDSVDYKIMDPVSDYNPDIVGDIHNMPFKDNSKDALICIAVLEHVENPIKASAEIFRILKKDGYAFVYTPFLYYYHAERGYYKDYWRFTEDVLRMMFKDFSEIEICPVRGALGTWIRLSPLGRYPFVENIFYYFDKVFGKLNSKQVSGYNIFLKK